jgi:signal transduction histidine kinase
LRSKAQKAWTAVKSACAAATSTSCCAIFIARFRRQRDYPAFASGSPQIPIVALTSSDDQSIIANAVKQGAEDYLIEGAFNTESWSAPSSLQSSAGGCATTSRCKRDSALESARLHAEFRANMSYEIDEPLNRVIGFTRLLVDTGFSGDQREMIEIARTSADALLTIVNGMLDFYKISARKMVLEEVHFDVGRTVEIIMSVFTEQARTKGVAFDCLIHGDMAMRLRGDPGCPCQILTKPTWSAVRSSSPRRARLPLASAA